MNTAPRLVDATPPSQMKYVKSLHSLHILAPEAGANQRPEVNCGLVPSASMSLCQAPQRTTTLGAYLSTTLQRIAQINMHGE